MYQSKTAVSGNTLHKVTESSLSLTWAVEAVDFPGGWNSTRRDKEDWCTFQCEECEEEQELEAVLHLRGLGEDWPDRAEESGRARPPAATLPHSGEQGTYSGSCVLCKDIYKSESGEVPTV
jgi:hypothetical protein